MINMGIAEYVLIGTVVVLMSVLMIIGLVFIKKRHTIYKEYRPYFGPFKAYCALSLMLPGTAFTVYGIFSLFGNFTFGITAVFGGLVTFALGYLICYLTDKKAKANGVTDAVKNMIFAGCATTLSISLKSAGIMFFIILLLCRRKRTVVYYED